MSDEQIGVLLIDDNAGDVLLVRKMLAEAGGNLFAMECADRLASGLERLARGGIDVVLLDLSLPDSHGPETFEKIRAAVPGVATVLLSALDDEALALRLVQAGAQDYLVKNNVNSRSLGRVLRYAAERNRMQGVAAPAAERTAATTESGKIIAFAGAKGGIGTSTTAINVGAHLAKKGAEVIVVELRSNFGTFSQQLHHVPAANLSHLSKLDAGQINAAEISALLVKLPFGLRAIFGPQTIAQFEELDPTKIAALLRCLAQMAEFVILDLPGLGPAASKIAVRQADCVGLVVDREPLSIVCALKTLEEFRALGVSDGLVATVIVNRSALPNAAPISEINAQLGCNTLGVMTPAAEICARANQAGSPFVLSDPDSTVAGTVADIASRLAAHHLVPAQL
jgi:MinD-like ATPase involved in chromosome partitioning or flagellar assembly/CheY-like chemotaxis protein